DDSFDTAKGLRPMGHRMLIESLNKQGKYEQALKLIDNLLKAKDHWEERQIKASILRESGKYGESAKLYEDVLERIAKDKELKPEEKELELESNRYTRRKVYVDRG